MKSFAKRNFFYNDPTNPLSAVAAPPKTITTFRAIGCMPGVHEKSRNHGQKCRKKNPLGQMAVQKRYIYKGEAGKY